MATAPEVTVLMTAYNAAAFIRDAVDSVLKQSFSNFEFIIVNDGSTDETESIIRSFKDQRIVFVSQTNKGIAASLNHGLSIARSEWIARFDADDICDPNRLQIQVDFVRHHTKCIIVGAAADYINQEGDYIFTYKPPACSPAQINQIKNKICPFIHSSVLYRKDVVIQSGGYDLHTHGFEDHFLWLKILRHGEAYNIPEPLLKVRLNPGSTTIDERWRTRSFRNLKSKILHTEKVSESEGRELAALIKEQDRESFKEGAYHALLGKKYLWNNHNPVIARENLRKSWQLHPRASIVFLWCFSFLPARLIRFAYQNIRLSTIKNSNP
jgi:glycosyltransferase involved in cell wall biosynthesis